MPQNSSRRPVIGMLTADSAPSVGGLGRHVDCLSAGLRAAGWDVRVFDVRALASYRIARNLSASLRMRPHVRRWIAREGIGVLHAHGGPGGVLPLGGFGVPVVMTANHTYAQQSRVPGQAWKAVFVPWERAGYRAADSVTCISPGTRDELVVRYGIDPAKTSVVECGFDIAPWAAADREPAGRDMSRCVFVGRPQARKGWDILIAAWRQIRKNTPDAVLHVAGFGEGPALDGVTYLGRLSDAALRALVGSSRLLLMPSRVEGFGLAAAEAVCAGTPVVGCDVPGLQSTVENGRTGVLGAPDAHCFAENAAALLRDRAGWERLHAGCRSVRGRFGIAVEVAAYERVYAAVYSSV